MKDIDLINECNSDKTVNTTGSTKDRTLFFENLITIDELAAELGIAPKTIRNWVALRKIPFIRLGRRTLFRQGSLKEWLDRKEIKPCL